MLANTKIRFLNMQSCRNFVQLILVKGGKICTLHWFIGFFSKSLIDEEFVEFIACFQA